MFIEFVTDDYLNTLGDLRQQPIRISVKLSDTYTPAKKLSRFLVQHANLNYKTGTQNSNSKRKANRTCLENLTKQSTDSTTSQIWNKINRFCVQMAIRHKGHLYIGFPCRPILIANHCGKEWARYAFDDNFSTSFRSAEIFRDLNCGRHVDKDKACVMEKPITMLELCSCLHKVNGTSPGFDRISYQMVKSLSHSSKTILLETYSNILHSGVIPHSWKLAVIVPMTLELSFNIATFMLLKLLRELL
ncbi:hypothetical protein EVAR_70583_1 [Eumeta japonica]|uniref:RNA-directed DNA polymerase from mobile element jockey n=1 Tax=Eumeta variegata TaxID=151549 RepID=A0A4C1T3W2_EUMVA|nr:hypothetical protein EVAR_70583_1 [Eumeta japonica]